MGGKKISVAMTASGRAKEYPAGSDIREVLESIYSEHQTAGSDWDRPVKLFVGGELIVSDGLTDIAWEYGKFYRAKEEELEFAVEEWIDQRFNQKPAEAA